MQLLDAYDRGILDGFGRAVLRESCVDLTSAEDDALDGFRRVNGGRCVCWVRDDGLES